MQVLKVRVVPKSKFQVLIGELSRLAGEEFYGEATIKFEAGVPQLLTEVRKTKI